MKKVLQKFVCSVVALIFCGAVSFAQTTTVDTGFNAVASNPIPEFNAIRQLVQPDGKLVIWGASLVGDGKAKGEVMRLNADGSVDQTFSYCICGLIVVENVALLANGQYIVAGSNGLAKMIRLNSDGSLDPSFVSGTPPNPFGSSTMTVVAIQPDGKILAVRRQANLGFAEISLFRFNQDGSVDSGFLPIGITAGSPAAATLGGLIFLPDGRFYLAITRGTFIIAGSVQRYNTDGTVDSTWETPNFGGNPSSSVTGISLEANGSLLVAGQWGTINGLNKQNLIRLLPAGNVDVNFSPVLTSHSVTGVESLPDGKILYSQRVDTAAIFKLFRLNSDGTPDNTFTMDPTVDSVINKWVRDSSENIIFLGLVNGKQRFVRLFPNGGIDSTFNPNVTVFGKINAMTRQTDGKIIAVGMFSQMNGVLRSGIARVDSEGNLDPSFDPGTGFDSAPSMLVVQSDGKILAIGSFSTYNGSARSSIARINPDGSLDAGFAPIVSGVSGISLQTDGKIIISGSFTIVNGTGRTRVARLETNGDLDNSFNTTIGSGTISQTIVQSDGKIMISGGFSGVNGFNRSGLVRLNSDGSLDQTFNVSGGIVGAGLWIQPDGKYITANTSRLARKNSDGSPDNTFVSTEFSDGSSSDTRIHSVLIMPDGSLIVGGNFDRVGGFPRRNLTRLKPNGELDPLFLIDGANEQVRVIIAAGDSKVLIGGEFTKVELTSQPGISRLIVNQFRSITPFDFDGDGKADISVFRPSENKWYIFRSSDFGIEQRIFAIGGDLPIPSDYDGDGKTDLAIFRPSLGDWWYQSSFNNAQLSTHWGNSSDTALPSDFDGDGRADYIVFRAPVNTWYRLSSANGVTSTKGFGLAGDKPVIGDFDGDGKSDLAIYRPSTGTWWYQSSIDNSQRARQFGIATDIPVPADYDGDGITDFAVYRPSTGVWYILNTSTGQATIVGFGLAEDKPIAADYDGDGKADIAVYRPSTGVWYLLRTTEGFTAFQFGISTDIPIPNAFIQ